MSVKTEQMNDLQEKVWFQMLYNKLPNDLLELRDSQSRYYWDQVDEKNLKYHIKQCIGRPWANHFALVLLCITDRNLSPQSIFNMISVLNARFRDLFGYFNLSNVNDLNVIHVEQYVTGQIFEGHSDRQRHSFLTNYNTFLFNLNKWVGTQFTESEQQCLLQYMLPNLPFDNRDFNARTKAVNSAKTKRKEDTSAITPLLPDIRAEGHLRWNQVSRLREAYREAVRAVREDGLSLPIEFNYEESEYVNERWYFKLWDISSFDLEILDKEISNYDNSEKDYFLEFVKAENIDDGSEGDGPWFLDILRLRILGNWQGNHPTAEKRAKVVNYLRHWGYEVDESSKSSSPFSPRNSGLLIQGFQITRRQRLTDKLLINIEPIYVACMFARFALDVITSSGARINEVLQISYDKDCCVVTFDRNTSPPQANY
ncbi:hypothetical protein M5W94_18720, partial [Paenibacillus thiaminolyticus]|nr:hypothetical protein [Paenibacillus thiaminolyticus]